MPPKRKGARVSSFLITFNTNQPDQKYVPLLKQAWKKVIENLPKYISHRLKDPENQYGKWGKYEVDPSKNDLIKSVEIKSGVETGDKKGFAHLHSAIRIVHESNIHFEPKLIKEDMNKMLGLMGSHIDVKGVADQLTNFEKMGNYAEKDSNTITLVIK